MVECVVCLEARKTGKYGCSGDQRWDVHGVRATTIPFLLHIEGWNHCSGERFLWGMNDYQIPDWVSNKAFNWQSLAGATSQLSRQSQENM